MCRSTKLPGEAGPPAARTRARRTSGRKRPREKDRFRGQEGPGKTVEATRKDQAEARRQNYLRRRTQLIRNPVWPAPQPEDQLGGGFHRGIQAFARTGETD